MDGSAVARQLHFRRDGEREGVPAPRSQGFPLELGLRDARTQATVKVLQCQMLQLLAQDCQLRIGLCMADRLVRKERGAARTQKCRRHASFTLNLMHHSADRCGQFRHFAQVAHLIGRALVARQRPQHEKQKACHRQGQRQRNALANRNAL